MKGNDIVSQYSMDPLNDLGLLKMDFLGLKTLTVIEDTLKLIHGRVPEFSLKTYPAQRSVTLRSLQSRRNHRPVPDGIRGDDQHGPAVRRPQDGRHHRLIALYRPGPMDLIGDYIKRKKGLTKIRYEHPLLEEICADTYGVMIYQEQVMAAASKLAGYSLAEGDLLRRAMGKKDKEKMAKSARTSSKVAPATNKIPEKKANSIFDLLEKFAGYGFNKSHSAAYGVDQLSNRVFESALSGRVHGRFAQQRNQ